jgi:hypothetical protein
LSGTLGSRDAAACVPGHADARHRVVHVVGGRDRRRGCHEGGHEAVAECLHDVAATRVDDLREQGNALRHHRGRVGVAERFVHRRAAAQIGEEDGRF